MTTFEAVLPNVYGVLPNVESKGSAPIDTIKTRVCRTCRTLPNLLATPYTCTCARTPARIRTRSRCANVRQVRHGSCFVPWEVNRTASTAVGIRTVDRIELSGGTR